MINLFSYHKYGLEANPRSISEMLPLHRLYKSISTLFQIDNENVFNSKISKYIIHNN